MYIHTSIILHSALNSTITFGAILLVLGIRPRKKEKNEDIYMKETLSSHPHAKEEIPSIRSYIWYNTTQHNTFIHNNNKNLRKSAKAGKSDARFETEEKAASKTNQKKKRYYKSMHSISWNHCQKKIISATQNRLCISWGG